MYQIVYSSRARRSLTDDEVDALAANASDMNQTHGITGLLLYDGKRFIQALEGDQKDVEATMARISNDTRHHHIAFMHTGPIEGRQFGDWAMKYRRADDGCCTSGFLESVKSGTVRVKDPFLQAAFIGFASMSANRMPGYQCAAALEITPSE